MTIDKMKNRKFFILTQVVDFFYEELFTKMTYFLRVSSHTSLLKMFYFIYDFKITKSMLFYNHFKIYFLHLCVRIPKKFKSNKLN